MSGSRSAPVIESPVALLGGGVIGGGWAARFLLNGVDVRLFDPDPDAERKTGEMLANARRAYDRLTLAPLPAEGALTVVGSVGEAVADAGFVQESAPERLELKQRLLADADRVAAPETVIASSTSGLRPTRLQEGLRRPERIVVGHPFNPVYLLPLVEVCGGVQTSAEAVERAAAVYRSVGMHPLVLRRELDGFVADRLLEALWREALWLVNDDVATVAEVDDAIRFGAGLRWACMGSFLTYRIAGGEAGMRHFIAQFGPALRWPWTKLTDVPELTPELVDKVASQSDEQAAGRSLRELERERDDCIVALLHALRAENAGAGATLATWERHLLSGQSDVAVQQRRCSCTATSLSMPFITRIPAGWVDYNGHVHESRYLQLFGDATDALLGRVGIDADYLESHGSYFTVETHLSHLGELHGGDVVRVETQVLGADEKRLHLFHSAQRGEDEVATAEQMLLHVDATTRRTAPAGGVVAERVAALAADDASRPRPERAGRRIALP